MRLAFTAVTALLCAPQLAGNAASLRRLRQTSQAGTKRSRASMSALAAARALSALSSDQSAVLARIGAKYDCMFTAEHLVASLTLAETANRQRSSELNASCTAAQSGFASDLAGRLQDAVRLEGTAKAQGDAAYATIKKAALEAYAAIEKEQQGFVGAANAAALAAGVARETTKQAHDAAVNARDLAQALYADRVAALDEEVIAETFFLERLRDATIETAKQVQNESMTSATQRHVNSKLLCRVTYEHRMDIVEKDANIVANEIMPLVAQLQLCQGGTNSSQTNSSSSSSSSSSSQGICPPECFSCHPGGASGIELVDGRCTGWCSSANACGTDSTHQTGGKDCSACAQSTGNSGSASGGGLLFLEAAEEEKAAGDKKKRCEAAKSQLQGVSLLQLDASVSLSSSVMLSPDVMQKCNNLRAHIASERVEAGKARGHCDREAEGFFGAETRSFSRVLNMSKTAAHHHYAKGIADLTNATTAEKTRRRALMRSTAEAAARAEGVLYAARDVDEEAGAEARAAAYTQEARLAKAQTEQNTALARGRAAGKEIEASVKAAAAVQRVAAQNDTDTKSRQKTEECSAQQKILVEEIDLVDAIRSKIRTLTTVMDEHSGEEAEAAAAAGVGAERSGSAAGNLLGTTSASAATSATDATSVVGAATAAAAAVAAGVGVKRSGSAAGNLLGTTSAPAAPVVETTAAPVVETTAAPVVETSTSGFSLWRRNEHPRITTGTDLGCLNLAMSMDHSACLAKCAGDATCKEVWAYDNGRCCMKTKSTPTAGWRHIAGGTYYKRK
jgi:hypothetical protein